MSIFTVYVVLSHDLCVSHSTFVTFHACVFLYGISIIPKYEDALVLGEQQGVAGAMVSSRQT
jgi:hypothetical protein